MENGRIINVNGPIVQASGKELQQAGMLEVVYVGEEKLIGEIIRLQGKTITIQVYEDTTGLGIGDMVYRTKMPLSLKLGPGLLGNIYDGIQRPLESIYKSSGSFIGRGEKSEPLDINKRWHFKPIIKKGTEVWGGMKLGEIQETKLIKHYIMVPPEISGNLISIVEEGDYTVTEICAVIETGTGKKDIGFYQTWAVRRGRPYKDKLSVDKPLVTGQRIIDSFFPIAKGGAAAIPGSFGTGKTMTQQALSKWSDADIIIYIGCGERGNEMTDVLKEFPQLIDPKSNLPLMERTILIANTSNMPVAAREASIYTGITIAEYYRDMGYAVAILADSTSRWAEALRELGGRLEEMPAEEGFPAYLPTRLAEFYERAGAVKTLDNENGSISIVGAVSPPGGDFSEPVTQHTKRFVRCFWALDRQLANARHYPAISWLNSYSEYIESVINWWKQYDREWYELQNSLKNILIREDKLQQIVKLIGPEALPDSQRLILLTAELIKDGILQQNAFDKNDKYSSPEKQVFMLRMIYTFHSRAEKIIELGAPLIKIRNMKIINTILKMKFILANDDLNGFKQYLKALNTELDELERKYS